eukprot:1689352-Amphidinium_carterae.1
MNSGGMVFYKIPFSIIADGVITVRAAVLWSLQNKCFPGLGLTWTWVLLYGSHTRRLDEVDENGKIVHSSPRRASDNASTEPNVFLIIKA